MLRPVARLWAGHFRNFLILNALNQPAQTREIEVLQKPFVARIDAVKTVGPHFADGFLRRPPLIHHSVSRDYETRSVLAGFAMNINRARLRIVAQSLQRF